MQKTNAQLRLRPPKKNSQKLLRRHCSFDPTFKFRFWCHRIFETFDIVRLIRIARTQQWPPPFRILTSLIELLGEAARIGDWLVSHENEHYATKQRDYNASIVHRFVLYGLRVSPVPKSKPTNAPANNYL